MNPIEFWVLRRRETQEFFQSATATCGKDTAALLAAKRCKTREEIDAFRREAIAAEITATGKQPLLDVAHFRVSAEAIS